jgi:ribosomal protein L29
MKSVPKKELRAKTVTELYRELTRSREKVADLRKELAFGKLKSPQKLKREKKKIAFILTIIREKVLEELEKNEED